MKRLVRAGVFGWMLIWTAASHGQGMVFFANYSHESGHEVDARVTFADGTPVAEGYTAQLYAGSQGTAESALKPVLPTTTFRTGPTTAGYILPIALFVPGVDVGETGTFQMRVFNGETWETSPFRGESNLVDARLSSRDGLPPNLVGLEPFQVLPVPEPGTIAILCVGLLLFVRGFSKSRMVAKCGGLVCLLPTVALQAQGIVDFNNLDRGEGIDARVTFLDGSPVGEGYQAQIYFGVPGTAEGSLQPALPVTTFRPNLPGYIWPNQVTVPGIPGHEMAMLQIRVFNGTDWENSTCRGASEPITIRLTGGTQVPAAMTGLQPFQVDCVPEPSTWAIIIIGMAAVMWHRFSTKKTGT